MSYLRTHYLYLRMSKSEQLGIPMGLRLCEPLPVFTLDKTYPLLLLDLNQFAFTQTYPVQVIISSWGNKYGFIRMVELHYQN